MTSGQIAKIARIDILKLSWRRFEMEGNTVQAKKTGRRSPNLC